MTGIDRKYVACHIIKWNSVNVRMKPKNKSCDKQVIHDKGCQFVYDSLFSFAPVMEYGVMTDSFYCGKQDIGSSLNILHPDLILSHVEWSCGMW